MSIARPPHTPMEHRLAGYWSELLGLPQVGRGDHFIELGGNSLLATLLANRIEDELGIRPMMGELFDTLERVAVLCEGLLHEQGEDVK